MVSGSQDNQRSVNSLILFNQRLPDHFTGELSGEDFAISAKSPTR